MQVFSILLVMFMVVVSSAEPVFRFFTDDDAALLSKRANLRGLRDSNWGMYPAKRARELFGKRSAPAEKRRPTELLGKRSAPVDEESEDYSAPDDYVYEEEMLRALNGLKRERRARVRELLG